MSLRKLHANSTPRELLLQLFTWESWMFQFLMEVWVIYRFKKYQEKIVFGSSQFTDIITLLRCSLGGMWGNSPSFCLSLGFSLWGCSTFWAIHDLHQVLQAWGRTSCRDGGFTSIGQWKLSTTSYTFMGTGKQSWNNPRRCRDICMGSGWHRHTLFIGICATHICPPPGRLWIIWGVRISNLRSLDDILYLLPWDAEVGGQMRYIINWYEWNPWNTHYTVEPVQ